MTHSAFEEAPDFSYAYEQHQAYPTKRALMLVCKDWTEIATEFLYESVLVGLYGTGSAEKIAAVLRIPGRGSRLAWWVKRADINVNAMDNAHVIIQELCTNLRVLLMFTVQPNGGYYVVGVPILHPGSHLTTLSVTSTTLSIMFGESPSTLDHWRYLTIIILDEACTAVPILPQLLSLTIVLPIADSAAGLAAIGSWSWSCPLLTHLSVHLSDDSDEFNDVTDLSIYLSDEFDSVYRLIEHFGPQLTFFAFTVLETYAQPYIPPSTLYSFLKAMPNLKELVTPPLSDRVTLAEQGPLQGFRHEGIQVVGFPVHTNPNYEVNSHSVAHAQSALLLFPNLRAVRITSAQKEYTAAHCRENPAMDELKCLTSLARILEEVGIVLEDPTGEDVRRFILERG